MELLRLRTPAGRQDRSLKEDDSPIFKHLFGELATYDGGTPHIVFSCASSYAF
jgi:hypothetical protein